MSQVDTLSLLSTATDTALAPSHGTTHPAERLENVLQRVASTVAPVWPLKDFVATNPYSGVSERDFLDARAFLRVFSDCETLMPLRHYAREFAAGKFTVADIEAAIKEANLNDSQTSFDIDRIVAQLESLNDSDADAFASVANGDRRIETLSEYWDRDNDDDWTGTIREEVSKYCAAHYDEGQAVWSSPWKHLPLYQAWRSAVVHDRNIEVLGLTGFRKFVSQFPETAEAAIERSLRMLKVPPHLWEAFLLSQAFTIPGWTAWTKYQLETRADRGSGRNDLVGLLAIRLAYDAAFAEAFSFEIRWDSLADADSLSFSSLFDISESDVAIRYLLLSASEIAFRDSVLSTIRTGKAEPASDKQVERKLAQMVFCIDVRSERLRRHLECLSEGIETYGFAGFFGLPVEFVPMGMERGDDHVPVLLKPEFQLHEGLHETDVQQHEALAVRKRSRIRLLRNLWKDFQTSAVGCFSFVETTGLLYGFKLFSRAAGFAGTATNSRYDGVSHDERKKLGPTLRNLNHQGVTTSRQVDLAEAMLRNLGLTENFARLVVFCGHASQTENNPLASGLDCGACGGHSGEPNARLAAMLLNQSYVRQALVERGIHIPDDTHFLAGLHNTTTDRLEFFDLEDVPQTHENNLSALLDHAEAAGERTRQERLPMVGSKSVTGLLKRSIDWSEVRPEWGLAGNAAFIVGPRSLTRDANLDGRVFLHSYDHSADPRGEVLENILTAPMIVAHLINMQYYASTVDNQHFGSGTKTVHNVVGRFGLLSGNGGDLMTGLPWQSLHTGSQYQHLPMRLQTIIAAPREAIKAVIDKHEAIEKLLVNGWLHLVALEGQDRYRYGGDGSWHAV